jgi:hypothetical protein
VVSVSDDFFAEAFHLLLVEVGFWIIALNQQLTSEPARSEFKGPIRPQRGAVQWMGKQEAQSSVRLVR